MPHSNSLTKECEASSGEAVGQSFSLFVGAIEAIQSLSGSGPGATVGRPARLSEIDDHRLFESARDGILIVDAESGRILEANPSLLELLDFSCGDVVGKTIGELTPFKDAESNAIVLAKLKTDASARSVDFLLQTRSGAGIAVEVVSAVYRAGDRDVIQCNLRDVSGRKRREAQLLGAQVALEQRAAQCREELQTANQDLEAFNYSVSHDLRAPLRHIMGFVEVLRKDLGPTLAPVNQRDLSTISQAAQRMGLLIDELLEFARLGRTELRKTDIHLDLLIRETLDGFEAETKARDMVWEVQPLPIVRADLHLLRQALVHLISNAVKFTGACARPKIQIGGWPSGDGVHVIFIRDNGAGFDPQYAGKLFGVFKRLHSQAQFEGTGMGLAKVQRIIQRHGGRAWAEGVVDGGATFYFSIPRNDGGIDGSEMAAGNRIQLSEINPQAAEVRKNWTTK